MIGLLQRVSRAEVKINGKSTGKINRGLLVFIGVEKKDTEMDADRLLERLLAYRVFPDSDDKMNLSLQDIQGGLLLVPQFTLAANTKKGRRPSFASAAPQVLGEKLFNYLLHEAKEKYAHVASGQFGADMQVHLINDGPVTFWIQTKMEE
ncbi:MAG TPA: D-tyrosyl-tRNA(Tyr) deacylase [Chromatiales bacterium]|nr:D-tyrosyl-tRNA(Tyr) deacylase [Thiotrichales bacterium]HIP68126.1 D-tyrosyl-tRNA(Tyr) deacylase [Chromatiales bacterium]